MLSAAVLLTQPDERLASLAADGSEAAFEAIVQRYRRPMLGYCRRMLLSDARAEDVVQQTFINAWGSLRDGTEVRNVKAWLYRITHNQAVSALRTPGYDFDELGESLRGTDAPDSDLERRTLMRETLAAVAALPELQREAILRTAIDGASYEEAGFALGVSGQAIRGLVYRARCSLRAGLAAIAPSPLVVWAASQTRRGSGVNAIAELLAGGGTAGGAAIVLKSAAVIATSAAVVGGTLGGAIAPQRHHRRRAAHASTAPATPRVGAVRSVAATTSGPRGSTGAQSPAIPTRLTVVGPASRGAAAPAGSTSERGTGSVTGASVRRTGSGHGFGAGGRSTSAGGSSRAAGTVTAPAGWPTGSGQAAGSGQTGGGQGSGGEPASSSQAGAGGRGSSGAPTPSRVADSGGETDAAFSPAGAGSPAPPVPTGGEPAGMGPTTG